MERTRSQHGLGMKEEGGGQKQMTDTCLSVIQRCSVRSVMVGGSTSVGGNSVTYPDTSN